MEGYYRSLAEALRERLALIADRDLREKNPELQLERLKKASERIDELKEKLPSEADPVLVHYLQRMSLSKALEFVEQRYL